MMAVLILQSGTTSQLDFIYYFFRFLRNYINTRNSSIILSKVGDVVNLALIRMVCLRLLLLSFIFWIFFNEQNLT